MKSCTADTTRVFILGEPTHRQRQIYDLQFMAKDAGEAKLRPGAPANEVDAAVRSTIEQAGYGACFPHHSGHAFGIFQQERPYIIPYETIPLEEGMVLTLEPGIYSPGGRDAPGEQLRGHWERPSAVRSFPVWFADVLAA